MEQVTEHLYRYIGKITSPNVRYVRCAQCGRLAPEWAATINTEGWYCLKQGGRVIEQYCPACGETIAAQHPVQSELIGESEEA